MRFDCCIGNPPYQSASGVTSIYQLFINMMMKQSKRKTLVIVPAKWNYSVQSGMREMKDNLLVRGMLDTVHYYQDKPSSHTTCIFPNASTREIVYFLVDKKKSSPVCRIVEHDYNGSVYRDETRQIITKGTDTIIFNKMLSSIMEKIYADKDYKSIQPDITVITGDDGELETNSFDTYSELYTKEPVNSTDVKIYGTGYKCMYISRGYVLQSDDFLSHYHALISSGFFNCILLEPGCSCNRGHVIFGDFTSKEEAENAVEYFKTKFFQFIAQTGKGTNRVGYHAMALMPQQDFSIRWTDEMLFKKYNLSDEEIAYVNDISKWRR